MATEKKPEQTKRQSYNFSAMIAPRQADWTQVPMTSIASLPPKKTVQISLEKEQGNWQRDFYRALAAGVAVPVATLPLEKIETQVTVKKGFNVAWRSTIQCPWSGYAFKASTNIARTFLLFNNTAYARDYFNQPGKNKLQIELQAACVAAVIEGTVMSFKTPIMQKIQTGQADGLRAILRREQLGEFYKAWRIACVMGVSRDLAFWPLWIVAVERMKAGLLVERQAESPVKMWEQFMIGSSAAMLVSPISFPVHGLMRRLIDEKCVTTSIVNGVKMDFQKSWAAHKASNQPAWKYVPSHIYRGFVPAALIILPLNMGLTNLFKHAADLVYDKCQSLTLFAPKRKDVRDVNELSYDYLRCSV